MSRYLSLTVTPQWQDSYQIYTRMAVWLQYIGVRQAAVWRDEILLTITEGFLEL